MKSTLLNKLASFALAMLMVVGTTPGIALAQETLSPSITETPSETDESVVDLEQTENEDTQDTEINETDGEEKNENPVEDDEVVVEKTGEFEQEQEQDADIKTNDTSSEEIVITPLPGSEIVPESQAAVINTNQRVTDQAELEAALEDTAITTIIIDNSFTVDAKIIINRSVTIKGKNNIISTVTTGNYGSQPTVFLILGENIVVQDLTIDGKNEYLHGIQAYETQNIVLKNVTSKNNGKAGLVVNGSQVTIKDFTTLGNTWYGINVDRGSGVTNPANLTVKGINTHNENNADIYVDDKDKADVQVNDTEKQYTITEYPHDGKTGLVYKLTPEEIIQTERTEIVTMDTATTYGDAGKWLFNRDQSTRTPFEFNTDESVIGDGALYVLPIGSENTSDKFIGEFFAATEISNINEFSYDYKIGSGGTLADANEFYLNVYANFGESDPNKFYDCKYDVVPALGSTSDFTTVIFDPAQLYPVTTRGGGSASPYICPDSPADMWTHYL